VRTEDRIVFHHEQGLGGIHVQRDRRAMAEEAGFLGGTQRAVNGVLLDITGIERGKALEAPVSAAVSSPVCFEAGTAVACAVEVDV